MFTPELSAPQHIILDFPGRGENWEREQWGGKCCIVTKADLREGVKQSEY